MRLLIIAFLSFITFCLTADEPRYRERFLSENKKFAFVLSETKKDSVLSRGKYIKITSEYKWKLINVTTNEKLYDVEVASGEKTAFISNDGKFIVVINDYPSESPKKTLEMINIFNNGQLIKKYTLAEILDFPSNISASVSHFHWMFGRPEVQFKSDKIKFTTYELNEILINISNGIMTKVKSKKISKSHTLVYGEITNKNSDIYEMEVCQKAFGTLKTKNIKFKSKKNYYLKTYYSVLIENDSEVDFKYDGYDINDLKLNMCDLVLDK